VTVRLSRITVFPVKSTSGQVLQEAVVEPLGLTHDRRWMVAKSDGECLTARTNQNLLRISATPTPHGLHLRAGSEQISVPTPTGPLTPVTVHGRALHGIPAEPEATEWVRGVIGRDDIRLVHLGRARPLNPAYSQPGDATGFADAYPVTLGSLASLRRLQDWVTEAALERGEEPAVIGIERFRPNLVIDGADLEPFVEDSWRTVSIGEIEFDVAKLIDRCVLTTVHPDTRERGPEPIRTLARHRAWDGQTWFGLQLIPRSAGTLRVGDAVSAASST